MSIERGSEHNALQDLGEHIDKARESIEDEFQRTANGWLACFITVLTLVYYDFEFCKEEGLVTDEAYTTKKESFNSLLEDARGMRVEYPEKTQPPESVKEELFQRLEGLKLA